MEKRRPRKRRPLADFIDIFVFIFILSVFAWFLCMYILLLLYGAAI